MSLFRRYQMYKHLLQTSLILNTFFLCAGFVALARWLQNHEPTQIELIFVGAGVLIFGILLPIFIFNQITKKMLAIRKQTEAMFAQYVSQWINTFEEFEDDEPLKNPKFWLNMALILFEALGDNSKHPGLQALGEFAPMLRKEIKSASHGVSAGVSAGAKSSRKRKSHQADD